MTVDIDWLTERLSVQDFRPIRGDLYKALAELRALRAAIQAATEMHRHGQLRTEHRCQTGHWVDAPRGLTKHWVEDDCPTLAALAAAGVDPSMDIGKASITDDDEDELLCVHGKPFAEHDDCPDEVRDTGQADEPQRAIDAAHLQRQREFSLRTFGPGSRAKGVVAHIRKELDEVEADPTDLSEWIDVAILALDGAWRSGAEPQQIIDALIAKQTRNEAREWPDWRTAGDDAPIEHVRAGQVVPQQPTCEHGWIAAHNIGPVPPHFCPGPVGQDTTGEQQ
jgi:hypothetical protein